MTRGCYWLLFLVVGLGFPPVYAQDTSEYETHLDDDLLAYCNRQTAYSTGVSDARKGLARKEDYAQICRVDRATLNSAYNTGYNFGLTNQHGLVVNEPSPNHPEIYQQLPSSYVTPYTRPVIAAGNPNVVPVVPQAGSGVVAGPAGSVVTPGSSAQHDLQPSHPPRTYPNQVGVPSADLVRPDPHHGLRSITEIYPSPHPKCIVTPTGKACGFNCVNSLNNVRCAATPDQLCRSNALGIIACGYHCISTVKTVRCALYANDMCVSDNNGNVFCGVNCRIERNAIALCDIERYAP